VRLSARFKISGLGLGKRRRKKEGEKKRKRREKEGESVPVLQVDSRDPVHILSLVPVVQLDSRDFAHILKANGGIALTEAAVVAEEARHKFGKTTAAGGKGH